MFLQNVRSRQIISNICISQFSFCVRLVCIWDNFFLLILLDFFPKNYICHFVKSHFVLPGKICCIPYNIQMSYWFNLQNRYFKLGSEFSIQLQGLEVPISNCHCTFLNMHLHSFSFLKWNKIVVYFSAQPSKV